VKPVREAEALTTHISLVWEAVRKTAGAGFDPQVRLHRTDDVMPTLMNVAADTMRVSGAGGRWLPPQVSANGRPHVRSAGGDLRIHIRGAVKAARGRAVVIKGVGARVVAVTPRT
jgi:hypothetical protein